MLSTEFIPASTPSSRHLLVVLHGLGDSAAGYRWLPGELNLPGLNYLLVNAPDEYYGGYSWFDIAGNWEPGVRRSLGLLAGLLEQQQAAGFPPGQTSLFGFSQGCLLTWELGGRHPQPLAGLVGICGRVMDPDRLVRELSPVAAQQQFLVTHGPYDQWFPLDLVRQQVRQLTTAGLNVQLREFPKDHTIAGRAELDVIREFLTDRHGFPPG